MKRAAIFCIALCTISGTILANETVMEGLSDAQRYDLADSYNRVADRYQELNDMKKSDDFRAMVEMIYPGFSHTEHPAVEKLPPKPKNVEIRSDSSGRDASMYYFDKALRGVFSENTALTVSVLADTVYMPLFDSGISKATAVTELNWFFNHYDTLRLSPDDIFDMENITVTELNNGYWRLDVDTRPEYAKALPELTFWHKRIGFYFGKFPEGWRLGAIGPVA